MSVKRNVAVLIFDEVEVLDFAGPFEVFSVTGRRDGSDPFDVYTVAEKAGPVLAYNRLSVNPHYALDECPAPDVLVVPGGPGTRRERHNRVLIDWISRHARRAKPVFSVCTGALLLAEAGLLNGLSATTHHGAIDRLRDAAPDATIEEGKRFVDNGNVVTSAGISAGIDASLHIVASLLGVEQARETAMHMEYDWERSPV